MVYQWCPNGYTKCVLFTTLVYTKQHVHVHVTDSHVKLEGWGGGGLRK